MRVPQKELSELLNALRAKRGWSAVLGLAAAAMLLIGVAIATETGTSKQAAKGSSITSPSNLSSPNSEKDNSIKPRSDFTTSIRKPEPPRIDTGLTDLHGNKVTVACSTCHATRKPNLENKTINDINEFHTQLNFSHGTVSCLSCHNPTDYDSLKLADGTQIAFSNVMALCAQCHGPQMIAYEHGAHGGMTGYWDLTRGPRVRNNCIDCHNPHSPQFPKMRPTFKPKDRFLEPLRTSR